MFHSLFKINSHSFTETSLTECVKRFLVSDELYLHDIAQFLKDWLDDKEYITVHTSGSTGNPKNIELLKEHMINSALATGEYFNTKEGTTALLCLSANYIAGKMMLVRAMVLGWDIHLVAPTATPLKSVMNSYDFCAMVPLQVESSLIDLRKIKKLIIGGAPISRSLRKQLQTVSTDCYATYGMTETITHIAVKRINKSCVNLIAVESYFSTLPNVFISLDDRGCLVVDASKVSDELIVTNDVVTIYSDTEFEWLGRYDNVINSGGVKLFPEQIEEKLSQVIKNHFFVIGIPDKKLGEKLVLIIESDVLPNLSRFDYEKCQLDQYEIPKRVLILPKFITTTTGKIQRTKTSKLLF